jgi:8-amino-7-oxononanoate synthase
MLDGMDLLGDSQIAPLVVGDSKKALELSKALAGSGIWAPPVRWPTVPVNSARIRFSLSAAMDADGIDFCAQKILENK